MLTLRNTQWTKFCFGPSIFSLTSPWTLYFYTSENPEYLKTTFNIGIKVLRNVKEYKYLGLTFSKLNTFKTNRNVFSQQSTKAMYFALS